MLPGQNQYRLAWAACAAVVATAAALPAYSPAIDQISGYCQTSWRNAGIAPADWEDCTQETFAELIRRVSPDGLEPAIKDIESEERRELNRSIWCIIQRWRRQPRYSSLQDRDVIEAAPAHGQSEMPDSLRDLLSESNSRLSQRQRRVLELFAAGHSIPEIAVALDLRVEQVSDTKYKAIEKLRRGLPSRSA